jgi:hypothetical protein
MKVIQERRMSGAQRYPSIFSMGMLGIATLNPTYGYGVFSAENEVLF